MTLYRIKDWNKRYENNRSRLIKKLDWIPVPNSHDGEAYARVMARKDAAEVFATWILLLQIASRCDPRGTLVRDNGQPLDAQAFSLKTRAPAAWFVKAVPVLVDIGWVLHNDISSNDTAPDRHPTDADLTLFRQEGGTEGKGMELKEGKEVGRAADAAPASDSEWLAGLSSNPAYQGIDVPREHAKMVTWCQANKKPATRRRFVNWLNRVDRPTGAIGQQRPAATPYREPFGWKAYLNRTYPDSVYSAGGKSEAHEWADVPRDVQGKLCGEIARERSVV